MATVRETKYVQPIKSDQDTRQYKYFELPNQMKVVVVSDPQTDKAAASLDVHVGQLHDPDDVPGLAHLLEHLLFMGNAKYPAENAYAEYLSHHGGQSNAFTALENTNYFFDVQWPYLEGALDIFSQFFISPLLLESTVDREIMAVNSEHDKNLVLDHWRLNQLDRSTSNHKHPYSFFGTGNHATLAANPRATGIDVRERLIQFHNKYYAAKIMCLCVLGRESIEELEKIVIDKFSDVAANSVEIPSWEGLPYDSEQFKKVLYLEPIKNTRAVEFSFQTLNTQQHYNCKPARYISHLIGHEGPGSLLALLKQKGWATALMAGEGKQGTGFGFFKVSIELTVAGLEHVDDITLLLFQYIQLIRTDGVHEWIYNECRDINDIYFRYKDKEVPYHFVSGVAHDMQEFQPEDVLCGQSVCRDFDTALINEVLSRLRPDNMRMFVVAKERSDWWDQKEKWYGTQFGIRPINEQLLEKWSNCGLVNELSLPPPNEYIPTDFAIRIPAEGQASPHPVVIVDTPHIRCWHRQDDVFKLPKTICIVLLSSPVVFGSPHECVMARLFTELLKDSLTERTYAAELAGVGYNVEPTPYGYMLTVQGYSHRLSRLLRTVVDQMAHFTVVEKRFAIVKDEVGRSYSNYKAEPPYQHVMFNSHMLCREKMWTHEEQLAALQGITQPMLQTYIDRVFEKIHAECYVHGNVSRQEARLLVDHIHVLCQGLPLNPAQLVRHRHVQLDAGPKYVYKEEEHFSTDSAIDYIVITGLDDSRENALAELCHQVLHEQFSTVLRTKEQLGYIVQCGLRRLCGVVGLRFLVQGESKAAFLDDRVTAFLTNQIEALTNMTEEAFNEQIKTLKTKKLEADKTMAHEVMRHWTEILNQQYNFDRANVEVKELLSINKMDLLSFYNAKLNPTSSSRQVLSCWSLAASHKAKNPKSEDASSAQDSQSKDRDSSTSAQFIDDILAFKRTSPLCALPRQWTYTTQLA